MPDTEDMKAHRAAHPSGWLLLSKSGTIPYVIDALLEAPPGWQFNQTELAQAAGVHRNSLAKYVDLLLELGIIDEALASHPPRYHLRLDSPVTKELFHLNDAINAVGFDDEHGEEDAEAATPNGELVDLLEGLDRSQAELVLRFARYVRDLQQPPTGTAQA